MTDRSMSFTTSEAKVAVSILSSECRTTGSSYWVISTLPVTEESLRRAHLSSPALVQFTAHMDLARTFVSFSSSDIGRYRLMCAWKGHEHIDFNFADFQLDGAINSENEYYIKSRCRARIRLADTLILLIGPDTWKKTTFVQWEVEVAIEKGCRLIGVNINNCRFKDWLCPGFFADKAALFVPYSSRIVAKALEPWPLGRRQLSQAGDFHFEDHVYATLGYQLIGDTAVLPPPPNPFRFGKPPWSK